MKYNKMRIKFLIFDWRIKYFIVIIILKHFGSIHNTRTIRVHKPRFRFIIVIFGNTSYLITS